MLVVSSVIALVLAGCSGNGGGGGGGSKEDFSELGLEATATTGVIRGVVVDPAIVPIVGAQIVIRLQNLTATTGEDGLFGFDGLDPGTYFLEISRAGYSNIQQSADVIAGEAEPPIVKVQLTPDGTTISPHPVQYLYTGYISCSYKIAMFVFDASSCDPTGAAGYQGRDDANPFFDVDGIPTYFQSEIIWDSTQPAGDELVTIQLACEDGPCGETSTEGKANRMCNVRGVKPLVCRVNGTEGGGGGGVGLVEAMQDNRTGFTVGVYANCDPCVYQNLGVGLVLEQQYQVFSTLFYGYLPPTDWLFTETNSVPQPPS